MTAAPWNPSRGIALRCDVDEDTFCSGDQQKGEGTEEGITTARCGGRRSCGSPRRPPGSMAGGARRGGGTEAREDGGGREGNR
jgi:hypothetical protein